MTDPAPEPGCGSVGCFLCDPPKEITSVATERLSRILDLEIALLRAQTCHSRHDPNQHLFAAIAAPVAALVDDARLRARHDIATS